MPRQQTIKSRPQQLDLFQVQVEYPKEIVRNQSQEIDLDSLDLSKNVLISNVKKDNVEHFLDGTAKIYYTGKRFPSTVALNKLYYFIPYIGKQCDLDYYGIRDLYLIKIARVGSRREGELDNDPNDLRLVFELQFIKHLFANYKKQRLQIWETYTDTTLEQLVESQKSTRIQLPQRLTYISLFSCAGIGCYGFKQENFNCVATVELIERRLNVQKYNHKCLYESGYICGDMTLQETQDKVFHEIQMWRNMRGMADLDVVIATPPCQGMSVANHKKGNELKRNSLVVESIKLIQQIKPRFFVFENVPAFLKSICTDIDGQDKLIKEAIDLDLAGDYNIAAKVINFKDYGNPSSRTRTLVIGVRKDLKEITPLELFPDRQEEQTLRQTIGQLPHLHYMGEIWDQDIYHAFRPYAPHMVSWIENITEGQSAFDNEDESRIPHHEKDGKIIYNQKKNGDKYTRQYWDKVPPCIHTRNDILASQNTVHPTDNRVFSIREVMLMMSVPQSFEWSAIPYAQLNTLPLEEKQKYLKKEDPNIRQSLGEAVPTIIFQQIAQKIKGKVAESELTEQEVLNIIEKNELTDIKNLIKYVKKHKKLGFVSLAKIAEYANGARSETAAYYTRQDICYSVVKNLPDYPDSKILHILEPATGVGNFLPSLFMKYANVAELHIDVIDINPDSIALLKQILHSIPLPENVRLNFINKDTLLESFPKRYDIVVGNPPYMKVKDKALLKAYKQSIINTDTNNIFSFFIEKSIELGDIVSLIVPKSLINAPEFDRTRQLMNEYPITNIVDFGEKGFKGVKIETIAFTINKKVKKGLTKVESYITNSVKVNQQTYITDSQFPYWLIYRNHDFDEAADKMEFGIFKAFRDRVLTKSNTQQQGAIRVLKSRNIGSNEIINIEGYDTYIDNISDLEVGKFLNHTECVLVPNLTYYPRACFMPQNCIADGSVAILTTIDGEQVTTEDLAYYATEEFSKFYSIARNRGTRSLNIDNNSVFFFGKLK
jgi:DNA (cytosine-5)-methyltransferase 1